MCDNDDEPALEDSGEHCRHFDDIDNCDERCTYCGHLCKAHGNGTDDHVSCSEKGCDCEEWEGET